MKEPVDSIYSKQNRDADGNEFSGSDSDDAVNAEFDASVLEERVASTELTKEEEAAHEAIDALTDSEPGDKEQVFVLGSGNLLLDFPAFKKENYKVGFFGGGCWIDFPG